MCEYVALPRINAGLNCFRSCFTLKHQIVPSDTASWEGADWSRQGTCVAAANALLLQVRDLNCVVEHLQQSQRDLRNTIKVGGNPALASLEGRTCRSVRPGMRAWQAIYSSQGVLITFMQLNDVIIRMQPLTHGCGG